MDNKMKKEVGNGFYTISKRDVYEDIQLIKKQLEELDSKFTVTFNKFDLNFNNHLQHHRDIEGKNKWFIGIIVGIVSLFINLIFSLL
jgi:hypothetical protein